VGSSACLNTYVLETKYYAPIGNQRKFSVVVQNRALRLKHDKTRPQRHKQFEHNIFMRDVKICGVARSSCQVAAV
jgi:hypothetical protein